MQKTLFFVFLLSFTIFSCRVEDVDSLYLGSVKVQTLYDKSDLVPYPNVDFAIPSFVEGFVESFNEQQEDLPSDTQMFPPIQSPSLNNDAFKAAVSGNRYAFLKNNFDYLKLDGDSKQSLLQKSFSDFWLSIDAKTNLWQQRMWGTAAVYLNGRVFYKKSFSVVSKRIILDKNSPYVSSLDKQLNIEAKGDYQDEIKSIYKDIGKLLAKQLKKDFIDAAAYDEYKKRQKEIRLFYEAERKSKAAVPAPPTSAQDSEETTQTENDRNGGSIEEKAQDNETSAPLEENEKADVLQ